MMNPLSPLVFTDEKYLTETTERIKPPEVQNHVLYLVIFFSNFGMISQVDCMFRLSLSRNSIQFIRIYLNLMCLTDLLTGPNSRAALSTRYDGCPCP